MNPPPPFDIDHRQQLFVKVGSAPTITIGFSPQETVLDLRRQIELKCGLQMSKQRSLYYGGKPLQDLHTFAFYCIHPGATLQLDMDSTILFGGNPTPPSEPDTTAPILPSLEEAEAMYQQFSAVAPQAFNLLDTFLAEDSIGNAFRSLLCGRMATEVTSLDDFYHLRLMHSGIPYHCLLACSPPKPLVPDDHDMRQKLTEGVRLLIEENNRDPHRSTTLSMDQFLNSNSGMIPSSTAKLLHGLPSNAASLHRLPPSSMAQRLATLTLAANKAIDRDGPNSKVQAKEASWAYSVIHKCSSDLAPLLRDATMNFGETLHTCLDSEYLDVQHGAQCIGSGTLGTAPEEHPPSDEKPSVTAYTADDGQFCVWHATNCFSPKFVKDLFLEYNSAEFYDANAIDAGEDNLDSQKVQRAPRFGRAVSFGTGPIAMEVKRKYQPPCDTPTPCETELWNSAKQLAELQIQHIKDRVGIDFPVTFSCNLLHVVAGSVRSSAYAKHSDGSCMTTSQEGNPIWMNAENDCRLPTESELQTLTWYFCNVDNACEISWSHKDSPTQRVKFVNSKHPKSKKVTSISMGKCGAHWQGPMSQKNYKHEITAVEKDDRAARIIVSCRFSIDPGFDVAKYSSLLQQALAGNLVPPPIPSLYKHTNVWQGLTEGGCNANQFITTTVAETEDSAQTLCTHGCSDKRKANPSPADDNTNEGPPAKCPDWQKTAHKDYSLKSKFKDTFPELPQEDYDQWNLHRSGKNIELGASAEQLLQGPGLVKQLLLDKGVIAWTKRLDKTGKFKKMVPNLFMNREAGQMRLFRIGHIYSASKIAQMAGGNHSTRQRDLYQPGEQEVLFLTAPYKNDLASVLLAQRGKDPSFSSSVHPSLAPISMSHSSHFGNHEALYVFGSGGSATDHGTYGPNIGRSTKDTYNIVIPPSQNRYDGGVNQALDKMASREGVVAVFSQYQNFNPGYVVAKPPPGHVVDQVQFLGYYKIVNCLWAQDTEDQLKESLGEDVPADVWKWSYFRTRRYLKFHLERLFTTSEWDQLRSREERYESGHQIYQHLPVDDKLENSFSRVMKIPISDSFKWKEDEFGQVELMDHCFCDDSLNKFVTQHEPGSIALTSSPTGIGINSDEVESDTPELTLRQLKGTCGTVKQCLDSVLFITQAGFQRYLGRSLTCENVLQATVTPLADSTLPLVHRMHAYPTGNRAMDTTSIFLRSEWNLYRRKCHLPIATKERVMFDLNNAAHLPDVINLLFRATLLRMTGRAQRFSVYQKFMKDVRNETVSQLPDLWSPGEVEFFTSFVKSEIGPNHKSMSSWISDQHKNQVPKQLRADVDTFVRFVTLLSQAISPKIELLFQLSAQPSSRLPVTRCDFLSFINETIRECVAADEDDVAFVAQAVMLDLEEMYCGIFPEPTLEDEPNMIGGPGCKQGVEIIKNSGDADTRASAVKMLLSEFNSQPEEYLRCFGAKKNKGEDFARWSINDRPLNIFDMEHFLCKVQTEYLETSFTPTHYLHPLLTPRSFLFFISLFRFICRCPIHSVVTASAGSPKQGRPTAGPFVSP